MIKIVIADDHSLMMNALQNLVSQEVDFEVVGRACNGLKLLEVLKTKDVDLVISDIQMPELNGIEATRVIKEKYPKIKVVLVSMHLDINFIKSAIKTGVNGYISKGSDPISILTSIRKVVDEGEYFPKDIVDILIKDIRSENELRSSKNNFFLTRRESQVLELIGKGLKTPEISEKLSIAKSTVETYRRGLIDKIGLKSAGDLLRYAIENNI